MIRSRFRRCLPCLAAAGFFAVLAAGCGGGGPSIGPQYKTVGKLLDNGKPLKPEPNTSITVVFMQEVQKGEFGNSYPSSADPNDGSFEVKGPNEAGIPAGKYRVKLSSLSMNPTAFTKSLNQRFSGNNSPILVDIVDGNTPIDIDIANPPKYKPK